MCIRDRLLNTSFRLPGNIFSCKDPPGKNILFVYSRLLIIPCSVVPEIVKCLICLLYTSDAADERSSVDLGGRRIIKKKKKIQHTT